MRRIRPALLAVLLLAPAPPAVADDEAEARKRKLAVQVMEVTGATANQGMVADSMVAQLKPFFPTVPEETWSEVKLAFDAEQLVEMSIPIYMRNFDEAELEELVEFYQSSLGKKVIERMPVVMQESTMAFQAWNREKLTTAIEDLKARGYEPVQIPMGQVSPGPPPEAQ